MALRVPTTTRVCLNCKINSDANAGIEFHEICGDVGLELQLPFLVKTFFYIDLSKKDKKHLCDDCVNRLIELYDLDELAKEKSCKTKNLNFHKPLLIDQNKTQANQTKSNSLENTNVKTFDFTQGNARNSLEINKHNMSEDKDCTDNENVGYFYNKNRSAPLAQQQNQRSNDIPEDFPEEDFDQTDTRKVLQDFNISLSSSLTKNEKLDELEYNEDMEFISDDENQDVEINKKSNANIIVNVRKEVDESEQVYTPKKTPNENEGQKSFNVEEVDDRSNQILKSNDSNSLLEELKKTKEKEAFLINASSSATELNNKEHTDADDLMEQGDISDDTCLLEEENLIEKIILTEEYDQVDLDEYLDKVLITKFQDLVLNWEMECKLCLEKYYSFGELLKHACMVKFEKEQQFSCIIKDCEEDAKDLPTLARHLILTHYDKLESTAIYGKCTDCQKTFSNVLDLNKHSCCQNIQQKADVLNCKNCNLNFQSFKRYEFHMQFHLKNHRPKICLLCGDIFNNSNDFFEHTQYTHNPESTLTCERCDRCFNDIQVFNNHMKMHEYSKNKYECAHCPKKYTNKFDLNQHMDTYHTYIKSKAFQCEYCPKQYDLKRPYLNHIKTHAPFANVETIKCSTCGLITNNMEMIKEHIESDKESPCFSSQFRKKILVLGYSCENCSLDFYTIKHLKAHRLSDSHRDDLFYCGMCRKSFVDLSQMRSHSFNANECKEWRKSFPIARHFVCNIGDCQEFYTSWFALNYHKTHHHTTEEKTISPTEFKCQFCQQLCSSKQLLAIHVAKIHNNAKLKCSHCKAKFPSTNILQKHIEKQHTPVECDICLKKFKHRRNFELHTDMIHNNVKRYFCKHCQKGFFHQKKRNKHEQELHVQL